MAASSSTLSTSSEEHDEEYLYFYQSLKFRENDDDKIELAHIKRAKLLLNHCELKRHNDRCSANWVLRQDLNEYADIVDDKDGLNNYAKFINNMCGKSLKPPTAYKNWTSNLESRFDDVKALIQELSLDKKTPEEKEADMNTVTTLRTNVHKYCRTTETLGKLNSSPGKTKNVDRITTKLNNSPSLSTIPHAKKTFTSTSTTGSFNPSRSFLSTISHQEHNNSRPIVTGNKRSRDEINTESNRPSESFSGFRTAKTELNIQNAKKYGNQNVSDAGAGVKRSLGARSRSVNSKFVPPIKSEIAENQSNSSQGSQENEIVDERLKGLDPKMIELIRNEIMDRGSPITWDDISGLEFAKKTIQEIVVWPLLRPDIFTGLRRPPKGILLFGPPGTGKTLIGKCIASQSSSTFFSISASSLTSKWIGESEKLVRTLFAVARCHQPAVIFIDEIDSLLSQRSESEHESSRRIKTEFLVQLDGATTHEDDRILVIGATNRPQELDEAARRRLVKRLYIPLPELEARRQIVQRLMGTEKNNLSDEDIDEIAKLTDGYSGADMKNLCQEASLGPIRSIDFGLISSIDTQEVRAVDVEDFKSALKVVRSSVSSADLNQYLEWDKIYGSRGT